MLGQNELLCEDHHLVHQNANFLCLSVIYCVSLCSLCKEILHTFSSMGVLLPVEEMIHKDLVRQKLQRTKAYGEKHFSFLIKL